jgi:hypothetical protein
VPSGLDPLGTFSVFATVVPNPRRLEAGLGRVMPRLLGFRPAGQPFRSTGATPPRRPDWKSELKGRTNVPAAAALGLFLFQVLRLDGPRPPLRILAAHPLLGFDFAAVGALRNGICGCHRFRRRREGALQRVESLVGLPTRRCSRLGPRPCMRFRTVRETPTGRVAAGSQWPVSRVRRDLFGCQHF